MLVHLCDIVTANTETTPPENQSDLPCHHRTSHVSCPVQVDQTLLHQLEAVSEDAIGGASWGSALEPEVIANLGKYRKYNSSSLRDLLRVIRNKHNHFREMPPDLQQKLGALPEGFLRCCPCDCLSICLSASMSGCLSSFCLPARPLACLSVCMSACQPCNAAVA